MEVRTFPKRGFMQIPRRFTAYDVLEPGGCLALTACHWAHQRDAATLTSKSACLRFRSMFRRRNYYGEHMSLEEQQKRVN